MKTLVLKTKLSLMMCTIFLTACGGGSSDNNSTSIQQPNQNQIKYAELSGTAFSDKLLISANITAICKDGSGFRSNVTTDEKAKWKGEVDSAQFPCRIEVNSGTDTYHGYARGPGNINLNPLTDVVIANASAQVPTAWYKVGSSIDDAKLKSAQEALITALKNKGYDVDNSSDFFAKKSDATSNEYLLVKQLFSALDKSTTIEDFNALLLLLKDGNFSQIPQKISTPDIPQASWNIHLDACTNSSRTDIEQYYKCSKEL